MGMIILTCFLVGVIVLALFFKKGRGCLVASASIVMSIVAITLLGGFVLYTLAFFLVEVL